jgi:hypothetical protein
MQRSNPAWCELHTARLQSCPLYCFLVAAVQVNAVAKVRHILRTIGRLHEAVAGGRPPPHPKDSTQDGQCAPSSPRTASVSQSPQRVGDLLPPPPAALSLTPLSPPRVPPPLLSPGQAADSQASGNSSEVHTDRVPIAGALSPSSRAAQPDPPPPKDTQPVADAQVESAMGAPPVAAIGGAACDSHIISSQFSAPLVIVGTALSKADSHALRQVQELLRSAGTPCSIAAEVQWGVTTHVIVGGHARDANSSTRSVDSADGDWQLARRTIKYCTAVLCGTCILSARWLHAVVQAGEPVQVEAFLIKGDHVAMGAPAAARAHLWRGGIASTNVRPPEQTTQCDARRLFSGIVFLLAEDELRPSGTASALQHMIKQGGGEAVLLSSGRAVLKRPRGESAGTLPANTTCCVTVHITDVKFPAQPSGLPTRVPQPEGGSCGTPALLNAVSKYSTINLHAAAQ